MRIITLTTDLGLKDHYLALVKAEIYKQLEEINIVDISHQISKFDIQEAAYIFKNCYKNFPNNTIHIIGVNEEITNEHQHIAIEIDNQYIIGPDNGIFSLIFNEMKPDKIVRLNISQESNDFTFAIKDVFVKAACHIARNGTLEMIGNNLFDIQIKKSSIKAVIDKNSIRGIITYIDSYGNATTNIDKATFKKIGLNRDFAILYGRENERLVKISQKYKDVPEGERLAIFSSNNLLEICINQGKANELLGLNQFDIIRVEFKT